MRKGFTSLNDLPITRKVMLGPIMIAFAMVLLAAANFGLGAWTKAQYEAALAQHSEALNAQSAVSMLSEGHSLLLRAEELSVDGANRARVLRLADEGRERIDYGLKVIHQMAGADATLVRTAEEYQRSARELIDLLGLEGARTAAPRSQADIWFQKLRNAMKLQAANASINAAEQRAAAEQAQQRALLGATLATLIAVAASLVVSIRVGRRIAAPLSAIVERVVSLAGGALDEPIPKVESRDEVGAIASALQVFRQTALQLHERAYQDPLTKLDNRAAFDQSVTNALNTRKDSRQSVTIMMMDLDRFKEVNDTLGHDAGDALLLQVAATLRKVTGSNAVLGRLGGDEFAVMLRGTAPRAEIEQLAKNIIEALSRPFTVMGHDVYIGVSIGIARCPEHSSAKEELLKQADLALYESKERSRNTFTVFRPELTASLNRRHKVEKSLREALSADAMDVAYQPQFDLATGRIVGVEALARWGQDERDRVTPSEFIPIAEATGLIQSLGEFVLKRACADRREWPEQVRLSLNLSARQLGLPHFAEILKAQCEALDTTPDMITLELSEQAISEDGELLRAMHELREAGFGLALDDFGAGSSPLRYLRRFPFSEVKIDGSFVREIDGSQQTEAVLKAMVDFGQAAGMRIVAEGVETREQQALLSKIGCNEAQGFLLCRPVASAGVASRIIEKNLVGGAATVGM